MILKLKGYLYAAAGIALTIIAFLARTALLKKQRDSARDASEYYKAKAVRAKVIAEADNEIEEQSRTRRVDALRELEDTGGSDLFRDPNRLRNNKDRADS